MVEQEPMSEQSSSKKKSRYPRPKWFQTIRDVLTSIDWWFIALIALAIYIIFSLGFFVINHHNDASLLLKVSNIISAFTKQVSLGIVVLTVVVIEVVVKVWAEQDKRRERAWQQEEVQRQQQQQEQLPPPSGIVLHHTLEDHAATIFCLAWAPDGHILASGSNDNTIRLWNPSTGELLRTLSDHTGAVLDLAWAPDGHILASGSGDNTLRLWNPSTGELLRTLSGHTSAVFGLAWAPDGHILASASYDTTIRLWNPSTGELLRTLSGHIRAVYCLAWAPDGHILASGSYDNTLRLWNPSTGQEVRILEGHTRYIKDLSFSADGRLLASKSHDGSIRLWRTDTWTQVSIFYESPSIFWVLGLAFHPSQPILATLGKQDTIIRIWDLDIDTILGSSDTAGQSSYTNAKVVLLGDSGVGKSGLGLVLSGQEYIQTDSTHGRRVWMFESGEVALGSGQKETRETLLWDLAGQPTYRIIHQLHLNEVAVALVVFDARSETDPFAGVQHWQRALLQAQRVHGGLPIKKFLVAARCDRGGIAVNAERIKAIVREMGFNGYIDTSAKERLHVAELQEMIRGAIDWNTLPKVSSTLLFQQIKVFLKGEKESGRPLSTVEDLYREFLASKDAPEETPELRAQFETCIGRVESAGLIKRLSFGRLVLLQAELLDAYASALVNAAKDDPDSLGSIEEEEVRKGAFSMPKDEGIADKEQEKLLLIAMIEDLLRAELALREEGLLVFPSQATRENPGLPDPEGKSVVFTFEGPVVNIYATLAVRLARSGFFKKHELWKNAITYQASSGGICGMFLSHTGEGHGSLTLFFDKAVPASEETRRNFEQYVALHLVRRALAESIKRQRVFICEHCGTTIPDQMVKARRERGFDQLNCPVCEKPISLRDREERLTLAAPSAVSVAMDRAADSGRDSAVAMTSVEGKRAVKDFDVFLCHHGIDKPAVKKIGEQLIERGLLPWLDEWELRPGLPWQRLLEEQIEQVKSAAVFVGKSGIGPWQREELDAFLREFVSRGCPVIPVLLPDAPEEPKLPVFLRGRTYVDFRKSDPEPMERLEWGITGERRMRG